MRRKHKHLIYSSHTLRGSLVNHDSLSYCSTCRGICRDADSSEYLDTEIKAVSHLNTNRRLKVRHYCQHHPVKNRTVYSQVKHGRFRFHSPFNNRCNIVSEERQETRKHIKEAIRIYSNMKEFTTGALSAL